MSTIIKKTSYGAVWKWPQCFTLSITTTYGSSERRCTSHKTGRLVNRSVKVIRVKCANLWNEDWIANRWSILLISNYRSRIEQQILAKRRNSVVYTMLRLYQNSACATLFSLLHMKVGSVTRGVEEYVYKATRVTAPELRPRFMFSDTQVYTCQTSHRSKTRFIISF